MCVCPDGARDKSSAGSYSRPAVGTRRECHSYPPFLDRIWYRSDQFWQLPLEIYTWKQCTATTTAAAARVRVAIARRKRAGPKLRRP